MRHRLLRAGAVKHLRHNPNMNLLLSTMNFFMTQIATTLHLFMTMTALRLCLCLRLYVEPT